MANKKTPAREFYDAMSNLDCAFRRVISAKTHAPEKMLADPPAQCVIDAIEMAEGELHNWLERRRSRSDDY